MKPQIRSKSGSTLIVLVVTVAVAAILAAVLTTALLSANAVSQNNLNSQQAYFTARSAVNTVIDIINKKQKSPSDINNLISSISALQPIDFRNANMGKGYVKAESVSSSQLKITGKGVYSGVTRYVCAYMDITSTISFVTNAQNYNIAGQNVTLNGGSICVPTNATLNCTFEGLKQIVCPNGNLTLNPTADSTVGDIITGTGLTIKQHVTVGGNLTVGADLSILNNHNLVKGSIICGTQASLNNIEVDGSVAHGGTLSGGGGIKGTVSGLSSPIPLVSVNLPGTPSSDSLNKHGFKQAYTYTNASVSGNKIISSGKIDRTWFQNNHSYTVDTSSGDLWLCDSQTGSGIDEWDNIDLSVTGNNKLYIYLDQNTKLKLGTGSKIHMADSSKNSNIYIIGCSSPNELDMGPGTYVQGAVFIPQGTFSAGGSAGNNAILDGCVSALSMNMPGYAVINYKPPQVEGTPIEDVLTPESGYEITYVISKWSNK